VSADVGGHRRWDGLSRFAGGHPPAAEGVPESGLALLATVVADGIGGPVATRVHEIEQRWADLEPAVAADRDAELRAAQPQRVAQFPAGVLDVLDHERQAGHEQPFTDGGDQLRVC
jgi:hypothetical protein